MHLSALYCSPFTNLHVLTSIISFNEYAQYMLRQIEVIANKFKPCEDKQYNAHSENFATTERILPKIFEIHQSSRKYVLHFVIASEC